MAGLMMRLSPGPLVASHSPPFWSGRRRSHHQACEASRARQRVDGGRLRAAEDFFLQMRAERQPYFSLPQEFYRERIFEVDLAHIWSKSWLLAGLSCQIPQPKDFLTYDIGDTSVVITRGADHKVRAFHNVCRHRGSRICRTETGTAATLVCPYHQWTYDGSSGALKHARDMGADFDKSQYGLHPAFCEELHGMIWVATPPAPAAPFFSFDEARATLASQMQHHGFDQAKIAAVATYQVRANWKVVYENNRECLHCNVGHPEYIKSNYDTAFSYAKVGDRTVRTPAADSNRYEEAAARIEAMSEKWQRQLGLSCTADSTFPGAGWYRATRNPMRQGWFVESLDGQPVCRRLMGRFEDPDMGSMRVHTFPNAWIHASSDHAVITRLTPKTWDTTEAKVWWIVHREAQEGIDYDVATMTPFWARTSEQDWQLCEDTHQGLMSPHYQPGPLSPLKEESVEKFILWYLNTTNAMVARTGTGAHSQQA